jgi:4-amino-4-deoxy-L-arabinose transferase-like glycosyltransferase
MAAWVEADRAEPGERARWLRGSGLTLALACLTKYPALLLLPVLLLHARVRKRGSLRAFWLAFLVPFLAVEAWLWLTYGRPHLWEVLSRAGEIPRGPAGGRALGVATRLGLGVAMLPLLLAPLRVLLLPAVGIAGLLALLGAPEGTDTPGLALLALIAVPGVGAALLAGREWVAPGAPRADVQRGDGLLLGGWALAVVLGVAVGHNFAAPRYLLPAVAPLALVLVRVVDRRPLARRLLWVGAALQGLLALGVTAAEQHFFVAGDAVARQAQAAVEAPGLYTGEWSFRHRMDAAGWRLLSTHAPVSGDIVAGITEAAPAELPGGWTEEGRLRAGRFPLRVVDSAHGVGLYGETIGPLPLGWRDGPLEEAVLWRVP